MEHISPTQMLSSKSNGDSSNLVNSGSNKKEQQDNNSGTASPDSTSVSLTTLNNSLTGGGDSSSASRSSNIFNNKNSFPVHGAATITELAELASSEISLDLQGLIDDTHFEGVGLFGDSDGTVGLGATNGYGMNSLPNRNSPTNSLGSSGQSSPGDSSRQDSPPNYQQQYRPNNGAPASGLGYIPGSVHSGASFSQVPQVSHPNNRSQQQQHPHQQHNNNHNSSIQVKQEPNEDFHGVHGMRVNNSNINNNNNQRYSNGNVVSSTTNNAQLNNSMATNAMTAMAAAAYAMNNGPVVQNNHHSQTQNPITSSLPSLKSFANTPKYLQQNQSNNSGGTKKRVERNSDEYRRRRERNNVAVRKSREKAKVRTKETEGRVKVLNNENDRLQKKVELLQEELSVLRSLFSNVGVLPDHIHRELSRQMDSFQQQHTAMGSM
jgi:CCAAT/enhancer binding protein (C/EBP)